MDKREYYVITNVKTREDSYNLYLHKNENDFFFKKGVNKGIVKFDEFKDAKYFINNVMSFGINFKITMVQEILKEGIVVKRLYNEINEKDNTNFNLTLSELSKEDIDELLFPEGRIKFDYKNLKEIIAKRDRYKKIIIMKINQLIDFHNMLDVSFSYSKNNDNQSECDGSCVICKEIAKQVELLDSPYLSKSLNKYDTAQKRFLDADGKSNNWSKEDLKVLLYDFNKLVANNPDKTIEEIGVEYYQSSKSPFYTIIRNARAKKLDYLFREMDNRKKRKKVKNK